jgi:hypothetical protein
MHIFGILLQGFIFAGNQFDKNAIFSIYDADRVSSKITFLA